MTKLDQETSYYLKINKSVLVSDSDGNVLVWRKFRYLDTVNLKVSEIFTSVLHFPPPVR